MPEPEENPPYEVLLRKQLLLLATLVVGVTYAAGINPPGGLWQENGSGHKAWDSILLATHRARYLVFYYCNSTALAASVVVIFLLLLKKPRRGPQLRLLRVVIMLDLIGFMGAYATGSNRDLRSSIMYLLALLCIILTYGLILAFVFSRARQGTEEKELDDRAPHESKENRKVLILLASFTAVIAYAAGLSSSAGYWDRVDSKYKHGDDVLVGLDHKAKGRFRAFFYCNLLAFTASLVVVVVVLLQSKNAFFHTVRKQCVDVLVLVSQFGLLGAYAAGTYRNTDTNVYVFCLVAAFLAYSSFVIVMIITARWRRQSSTDATTLSTQGPEEQGSSVVIQLAGSSSEESRKVKSLILLLATLTATITYQAGLNPTGGVWPDDGGDGNIAGHPILLYTHSWRYKVFFYSNSGAFVLSLAAILMLMIQKAKKIPTTLLVSVILDMVALVGAYAAGSWRDARSSIAVIVMAGAVIVYVMIHLLCITLRTTDMEHTRLLKKRHKRLVLVAILLATITYQTGLSPPGGFRFQWRQQDDGQAAGAVLLTDNYPRRLWAFFYCNTVSFMATMALILFFVSPNLYKRAVRCYALYGCILLALLGLMAANAAGIVKHVQTYAYVFVLLVIVVSVIAVHTILSCSFLLEKEVHEEEEDGEVSSAIPGPARMPRTRPSRSRPRPIHIIRSVEETMYRQVYTSHKYLILVAVLAASATYQAGLNPPGGLWQQDDGNHGQAGSPVLYDKNRRRYLAFFYSNSTSFVASVFIIALQLQQIMWKHRPNNTRRLVLATKAALVLDLLGLVAAYAAGTTWELGNAIALVVMVLLCMAIHVAPWVRTLLPVASSDKGTKSLRASSVELVN